MNTEKARLDKMLQEKKISQKDYNILITALDKKTFLSKISSSLLINPFRKIAGIRALILGLVILFMLSYFGVAAKVYFFDMFSMINSTILAKQTMHSVFLYLLYQNTLIWLVPASLFFIATKFSQQKNIRIIDFLGTVAFARLPMLIMLGLTRLLQFTNPELFAFDMSKGLPLHSPSPIISAVFGAIFLLGIAWQIAIYFYALKESSGLVGKQLWLRFLVSVGLSEAILIPLTTLFMN